MIVDPYPSHQRPAFLRLHPVGFSVATVYCLPILSPRPFMTAKSNGSRCASGRSTPIHSAISQNSMFSILLSTVMARRPSKNPISTKSHITAQSLTFIELSLSAMFDPPPSAAARCRLHIVGRGLSFWAYIRCSDVYVEPIFAPVGFAP